MNVETLAEKIDRIIEKQYPGYIRYKALQKLGKSDGISYDEKIVESRRQMAKALGREAMGYLRSMGFKVKLEGDFGRHADSIKFSE